MTSTIKPVYLVTGDRSRARPHPVPRNGEFLNALDQALDLLRFSRLRLSVCRVHIHGVGPSATESLMRRALGHHGFVGMLPEGEVVFVHIGEGGGPRSETDDWAITNHVQGVLMDCLRRMAPEESGLQAWIDIAHFWSDEFADVDGVLDLLDSRNARHARVEIHPRAVPPRSRAEIARPGSNRWETLTAL